MPKIIGHLVNPQTEKWFHYDEHHNLWTCDRENPGISLQLSRCERLLAEGEWNEIKHRIARLRKELDFLEAGIKFPNIAKRQ